MYYSFVRICANIEPHTAGRDASTMADLLRFHRYIDENPRSTEKDLVNANVLPSGSGRLYKWKKVIAEVHHQRLTVTIGQRRSKMKHYAQDILGKSISSIQNSTSGYKIGDNIKFMERYPVDAVWDATPPPNMPSIDD